MSAPFSRLTKLFKRRGASVEQPPRLAAVPVALGGSKPIEYVIIEEIRTIILYVEASHTAEVYKELEDHVKKKGYYLQVLQFTKA